MIMIYPAVFHNENDSFWVEFPDLEGCQSCGKNLPETIELAQEALGLYIASRLDNKESIPQASDITGLQVSNGFLSYVSCDADKYRKKTKAIKKTLTIPEWLNEEAEKKHINFSSVLQEALIEKIKV